MFFFPRKLKRCQSELHFQHQHYILAEPKNKDENKTISEKQKLNCLNHGDDRKKLAYQIKTLIQWGLDEK